MVSLSCNCSACIFGHCAHLLYTIQFLLSFFKNFNMVWEPSFWKNSNIKIFFYWSSSSRQLVCIGPRSCSCAQCQAITLRSHNRLRDYRSDLLSSSSQTLIYPVNFSALHFIKLSTSSKFIYLFVTTTASSTSTSTSLASWATHDHQHHRIVDRLLSSIRSPSSSIEFEDLRSLLLILGISQNLSIFLWPILFFIDGFHIMLMSASLKRKRRHGFFLESTMSILRRLVIGSSLSSHVKEI